MSEPVAIERRDDALALLTPRLIDVPIAGLYPIDVKEANRLVIHFEHDLGPCHRPFHQEAFVLESDGRPVAVSISASIVNGPVAGFGRQQVVELARLCGEPWANRLMIRFWREVCAPKWPCWPIEAGVSYQLNSKTGNLYRFDGWERIRTDAGSRGGGTWGRKRKNTEAVYGPKTLWVWRYV